MTPQLFEAWDQLHRLRGRHLEAAGIAPIETPSVVVHTEDGLRLRRYTAPDDIEADGPAVLIVPAPIKRHYIWDLLPSCSVVRRTLAQGFDVYLAEWDSTPSDWGFDAYLGALRRSVLHIEQATGRLPHLMGHSLGGTLAALYGARYPTQLASLVLIEAPLRFGNEAGAFQRLLAVSPTGAAMKTLFTRVPGTVLNMAAVMASPREFIWERRLDTWLAAVRGGEVAKKHALAQRWTLDEAPMPGTLFMQVTDELYREDRFMRGELVVDGRRIAPRDITVPIAAVVDPHGTILPAASVLDGIHAVPGTRKLILRLETDTGVLLRHLAALIGDEAHPRIWPRIYHWLSEYDVTATQAQPS